VVFEIITGYTFYIRDSSNLTGNYISSTIRVIDKIKRLAYKNKEKSITINENKLNEIINCQDESNLNHVLEIADMNFYRRPPKFQSTNEFLNTVDFTNKYIIFIAGNSEGFGSSMDKQNRIHSTIQEKLKNKFISKDIFVLNISDYGFNLNDQLESVSFFSKIYKPDLVIFYTGGNEIKNNNRYEDMIMGNAFGQNPTSLNIGNEFWYSFIDEQSKEHSKCLNEKIFLTDKNLKTEHSSLDIQGYIKRGFKKINTYLNNENIDFIFYIHPFSGENTYKDKLFRKNLVKLQNINIQDKRFINLSNENFNLDFVDTFHTKDSNIMANKIVKDILINYEHKITKKIN
jgi:hypothetical protein